MVIRDVDVSLNHSGRNAGHNGTARNVFEDDGVGTDHRFCTDANGAQNLRACSNKAAVSDHRDSP